MKRPVNKRENIKYFILSLILIAIGIPIFNFIRSNESKGFIEYYPVNDPDRKVTISVGRTYVTDTYLQTYINPDSIDDTFVLDILLPDHYDEDKTYPVVYLTDCYWRREDYPAIKQLYESGKTEEFILIGIGYPDDYDFGLTRERDLIFNPHDFLKLIVDAIIPYVESQYSIDANNRSFLGSSCGGYFMLYSLFQSDGLTKDIFQNYIINSPVFYYYDKVEISPFTLEEEYFKKNGDNLNAYVYITVGGDESVDGYIQPLNELTDIMNSRKYKGLTLEYEIYEGFDHYSVWAPALLEGLSRCLAK